MVKDKIDPDSVRFQGAGVDTKPRRKLTDRFYKPKKGEKFLCGPVPLWWINAAGSLPGKALHVGIRLWYFSAFRNTPKIKLNQSNLEMMGVLRDAARRGLRFLENAGLVTVERRKGCAAMVTIIFEENKTNGNGKESEMEGVS